MKAMNWLREGLKRLWGQEGTLARLGVLAFALLNAYAITKLLLAQAKHPSPVYVLAAIFVETATAITIWQIVEMFHKWSRSNQTKQDKLFYGKIMVVLVMLVTPSILTSIVANIWEFKGNIPYTEYTFPVLLGLLCPIMAIVCAILVGISKATKRREAKVGIQQTKVAKPPQKKRKLLPTAHRRQKVFVLLCKDPNQRPDDLGKRLGVTAQTIRNDFIALAKEGKIIYKDGRVALRPQKVVAKS